MPTDSPSAAPSAIRAPSGERAPGWTSEWGLDWGDVAQIRAKLALTPAERLRAAQDLLNRVNRIRAQNAGRG